MSRIQFASIALMALAISSGAAEAYIGPGVGAGALAAVLGVLGSIFLTLFAVIYYPIKRLLKRRKSSPPTPPHDGES